MYLAFLALYLITCFNYVEFYKDMFGAFIEPSNSNTAKYKDMDNNLINDPNYCDRRSCLVKCCGYQQYLDFDGTCKDADYFKEKNYSSSSFIEYNSEEVMNTIKAKIDILNWRYALLQRVESSIDPNGNFTSDFYLSDDGQVDIRGTEQWIRIPREHFCIDYRFYPTDTGEDVEFVYTLEKQSTREINNQEKEIVFFNYTVLSTALAISFLSMVFLIYRIWVQHRLQNVAFTYAAYFCTLILAYGLKILYLIEINAGLATSTVCIQISAALYFLLISAFCWPLILTYDMLSTLRHYCVAKKAQLEDDTVIFFRYCTFGWGVPLLLTVISLAVHKVDLSSWNIEKPHFDSCLKNDKQTLIYLYVPISILVIMKSLLYVIFSHDMWVFKNALHNNQNIPRTRKASYRYFFWKKVIGIVVMILIINFDPDFPFLLYVVLNISFVLTGITLSIVYLFEETVRLSLYNRFRKNIVNFEILKEEINEGTSTNSPFLTGGKGDKIAIISSKDLEKGNNSLINSNLEKNITIFGNIDMKVDNNKSNKRIDYKNTIKSNDINPVRENVDIINHLIQSHDS